MLVYMTRLSIIINKNLISIIMMFWLNRFVQCAFGIYYYTNPKEQTSTIVHISKLITLTFQVHRIYRINF